jgi:hypothetical protein
VALLIESGEPREVMHFALLIGYGASAVNPYLAIETLEQEAKRSNLPNGITFETALKNYKKAINKGLLKVFSKMGIYTLQSYHGTQVFEAVVLSKAMVDRYFNGTASAAIVTASTYRAYFSMKTPSPRRPTRIVATRSSG